MRNDLINKADAMKAFYKDLNELLKKHKVELNITDDQKPYGMHNAIVEVALAAEYEKGHEHDVDYMTKEGAYFELDMTEID